MVSWGPCSVYGSGEHLIDSTWKTSGSGDNMSTDLEASIFTPHPDAGAVGNYFRGQINDYIIDILTS